MEHEPTPLPSPRCRCPHSSTAPIPIQLLLPQGISSCDLLRSRDRDGRSRRRVGRWDRARRAGRRRTKRAGDEEHRQRPRPPKATAGLRRFQPHSAHRNSTARRHRRRQVGAGSPGRASQRRFAVRTTPCRHHASRRPTLRPAPRVVPSRGRSTKTCSSSDIVAPSLVIRSCDRARDFAIRTAATVISRRPAMLRCVVTFDDREIQKRPIPRLQLVQQLRRRHTVLKNHRRPLRGQPQHRRTLTSSSPPLIRAETHHHELQVRAGSSSSRKGLFASVRTRASCTRSSGSLPLGATTAANRRRPGNSLWNRPRPRSTSRAVRPNRQVGRRSLSRHPPATITTVNTPQRPET